MEKSRIQWLAFAAFAILLLGKLYISISTLHNGVDCCDEGQLLMGYRFPYEYYFFPYYQFITSIFGNLFSDIITARASKFVIEMISVTLITGAIYLWATWQSIIKRGVFEFLFLWLTSALSCLTFLFARVITYDDFIILITALSFFLMGLCWFKKKTSMPVVITGYAICGILLGFAFYIKASILVLLYGSYALLTFARYKQNKQLLIATLSTLTVAVVIAFVTGVYIIGGWAVFIKDFTEVANLSPISAYNFKFILNNYWVFDLKYLVALALTGFIYHRFIQQGGRAKKIALVSLTTIIPLAFLYAMDDASGPVKYLHCAMWLIASPATGITVLLLRKYPGRNFNRYLILFLVAIPMILPFGTANSLYENSSFGYSFYYLMVVVVLLAVYRHIFGHVTLYLLSVSTLFYVLAVVVFPYGISTNIFAQGQQAILSDKRLKTDAASAEYFNSMYKILTDHGYKKGGEILATEGMSGVVSTLGGKMPVALYLTPGNQKWNCYMANKLSDKQPLPFFIAFKDMEEPFPKCLAESKIHFPQNYKLVGKIKNPYCWAINTHYGVDLNDTTLVFAPVASQQ